MPNLVKAAAGLASLAAVSAATVAQADGDLSWIPQAIAASRGGGIEPEVKTATGRRAVTTFSGLARIDDDKPMNRGSKPVGPSCIPSQLQGVLDDVEAKFGTVKVTSTCRSASANRAAGGAPQSLHLIGQAVDFRVAGSVGSVLAFLNAHAGVGGLKHYGGGLFHIDTGSRRPF